jgi:phosphoribosyl 1,2-cyclic phosphate phosphodiesterase
MHDSILQLTVLGSGTSMGVPTLGCRCEVCRSTDPHDNRTRPSVLLRYGGRNVVIDTSPDFRAQAMRAGIHKLDAVLFTHGHADHILGLDDIRPYNLKQQTKMPVYATEETQEVLKRTFAYIFNGAPTESTVPSVELHTLREPFDLFGCRIEPVPAMHGGLEVMGFRIGGVAYLTDFSSVPESSKKNLQGLEHLILDALRYTPHPMHSNVEQSLGLVEELKPGHAWFTHISHDLGHESANARLPEHVRLAYDGLTIEAPIQ